MKYFICILFIFCGLFSYSQEKAVVGYLPTYRFKLADKIDYKKLTHLNICFASLQSNGKLAPIDSLSEIMHYIRQKNENLPIFISLAGGALHPPEALAWKTMLAHPNERLKLVQEIIAFSQQYGFDGIDVDLEWKNVSKGYSEFILLLKKHLKPLQMPLTSALPGTHRYFFISDKAFKAFDWINLMAYDEKGSWRPTDAGQHSSLDFAKKSIDFWVKEVGVPPHKLTLGLPLYGYDFANPKKTKSYGIGEIISKNKANLYRNKDSLLFYNGKDLIQDKIALAFQEKLKGIMLWELGQDTAHWFSMSNLAYQTMQAQKIIVKDSTDKPLSAEELAIIAHNQLKQQLHFELKQKRKQIWVSFPYFNQLKFNLYNNKNQKVKLRSKIKRRKESVLLRLRPLKKGTYRLEIRYKNHTFERQIQRK